MDNKEANDKINRWENKIMDLSEQEELSNMRDHIHDFLNKYPEYGQNIIVDVAVTAGYCQNSMMGLIEMSKHELYAMFKEENDED